MAGFLKSVGQIGLTTLKISDDKLLECQTKCPARNDHNPIIYFFPLRNAIIQTLLTGSSYCNVNQFITLHHHIVILKVML